VAAGEQGLFPGHPPQRGGRLGQVLAGPRQEKENETEQGRRHCPGGLPSEGQKKETDTKKGQGAFGVLRACRKFEAPARTKSD